MAQRITSLIHDQAHVLDQSENLEFVKFCGEQSIYHRTLFNYNFDSEGLFLFSDLIKNK